jgi:hypothetical protein
MRGQGLWARFVNIARAAATGGQVCAPANGTRNYATGPAPVSPPQCHSEPKNRRGGCICRTARLHVPGSSATRGLTGAVNLVTVCDAYNQHYTSRLCTARWLLASALNWYDESNRPCTFTAHPSGFARSRVPCDPAETDSRSRMHIAEARKQQWLLLRVRSPRRRPVREFPLVSFHNYLFCYSLLPGRY